MANVVRKRRSAKKIARSGRDKAKYQKYLTRSTCSTCRVVFKSPQYRLAHVESGHRSLAGANKNRVPKTGLIL